MSQSVQTSNQQTESTHDLQSSSAIHGAEQITVTKEKSTIFSGQDSISSLLTTWKPVGLFSESPYLKTPSYSASCSTPITDCYSYSSDSSISTQIERNLTKNTLRKMKLKGKLADIESKLQKAVKEHDNLKTINYNLQQRLNATPTLSDFEKMCDTFITARSVSNFIKSQARLCTKANKGSRYTPENKQFALMIHFYGPKVYKFLQKTWCLPNVRTLQKVTEKWEIGVGFSDFVLNVLSLKGQTMNVKGKDCVLCADKMSLKSFLYYNYSKDEVIGLHEEETHKVCDIAKSVLVLMIKGLHDSWKQPLGYFFIGTSCSGYWLKNIIFNCVSKLRSISFNVKVMISDTGAIFKSFTDSVGVSPEHPYFNVGSQEVIYIFDPPHLLKSTRNNFFKYRFVTDDLIIESKYLISFYKADKKRTRWLAPKLTYGHINPSPIQKMKVKYASQVFSKTVVCSMYKCVGDKSLPRTAKNTILFINFMNDLFDLFNSRPTAKIQELDIEPDDEPTTVDNRFRSSYSGSSYQKDFLLFMFNFFKIMKIQKFNVVQNQWVDVGKSCNIQFLKGWMISIAGLIRLHTNLCLEYENLELFTRRLSQDCLENLFSTMRIQSGNCINPTTVQFQRIFKKLFCLNYFEYNDGANYLDLDEVLTNLSKTPAEQLKIIFPEKKFVVQIKQLSVGDIHYRSLALPERNAFIYICSYLISKCLKIHSCDTCLEYARSTTKLSSDHFLAYFESHQQDSTSIFSSLMTPDSNFCQYMYELEQIFTNNFPILLSLPKVGEKIKSLMNIVYLDHTCPQFPQDYLLNLFIRFRIYITLTRTNRALRSLGPQPKSRKLQILCDL